MRSAASASCARRPARVPDDEATNRDLDLLRARPGRRCPQRRALAHRPGDSPRTCHPLAASVLRSCPGSSLPRAGDTTVACGALSVEPSAACLASSDPWLVLPLCYRDGMAVRKKRSISMPPDLDAEIAAAAAEAGLSYRAWL